MNQSLPLSASPLAGVLKAHAALLQQIKFHEDFLASRGGQRAQELMLYTTIRDTMGRRGKDGVWEKVDEKVIPTPEDFLDLLNRDKYDSFETLAQSHLLPMEEAAKSLIQTYLEPESCREYLASLPHLERLRLANRVATGLIKTQTGMAYLRESVSNPVSEAAPRLFHPASILDFDAPPDVPFDFLGSHYSWVSAAAGVFVEYYLKMVPALALEPQAFAFFTGQVMVRYYPAVLVGRDMHALTAQDLQAAVDEIKSRHQAQTSALRDRFGRRLASGLGVAFELINLWVIFKDVADGKPLDKLKLIRTVANLTAVVATAQEFWPDFGLKVSEKVGNILGGVIAALDVIMSGMAMQSAYRDKDYSVVAGNAIQGIGATSLVGMSIWTAAGAAGAAGGTAGGATAWAGPVAIFAVCAGFVGSLVVTFTAETAMELWGEHNFFGSEWDDVDVNEPPGRYFLFRTPDGRPNLPRQVSEFLSILQPVPITIEPHSYWVDDPDRPGHTVFAHWISLNAPADSRLEGSRLLAKQVIEVTPPGQTQARYRVRPIAEIEFDAFRRFDNGNRTYMLDFATLTRGITHEGPFTDWTLEIDVAPSAQARLDWSTHQNIPADDPNYLAPYLYVRRVRGGG